MTSVLVVTDNTRNHKEGILHYMALKDLQLIPGWFTSEIYGDFFFLPSKSLLWLLCDLHYLLHVCVLLSQKCEICQINSVSSLRKPQLFALWDILIQLLGFDIYI